MYKLILSPIANAFYDQASRPLADKFDRCFQQLTLEPRRHNNIKRLLGNFKGLYRYRVGDYRVIYKIAGASKQIQVLHIAHRSDVYS